ncbi:MAG: signal peptidase I [Lachnospiraceae bacterium]|nr:signal peptidase I [Lachnospiraceae bacterium]
MSENYETDKDEVSKTEESKNEESKSEGKRKLKPFWKDAIELVIYFLIVLGISVFIVLFVGQRTIVEGTSMNPTLNDKDNLIVDKITYRFNDPQRFDVIVFPYQHKKHTYYIKRIIGLPGETVLIDRDGNIYINDQILNEDYGNEVILDPGRAEEKIVLGEDEYFVLGDNRNNSSDSRDYMVGNIKRKDFIGRAWLRIFPFKDFGLVPHGDKEK